MTIQEYGSAFEEARQKHEIIILSIQNEIKKIISNSVSSSRPSSVG